MVTRTLLRWMANLSVEYVCVHARRRGVHGWGEGINGDEYLNQMVGLAKGKQGAHACARVCQSVVRWGMRAGAGDRQHDEC